jgi:hypothetical protein
MTDRGTISQRQREQRIEAIERTIDTMKQAKANGFRELEFDMSNWFSRNAAYDCGTAACIAGWIVHANSNLEIPDLIDVGRGKNGKIPDRARDLLHLTRAEAGQLFFAEENFQDELPFYNITIDHAILVPEHFQDSGNIAWTVIPDMADLRE